MISKNLSEKTFYLLLLIISLGIGLQLVIYKIALILLCLQWLISADFINKFYKLKTNKYALLLIGFYCWYAISLSWSEDYDFALIDLLLKSPLLLFPLIITTSNFVNAKQLNTILLVFALSSLAINLYAFYHAIFNYLETSNINSFYYHKLTINMHSAYQAMFTCFSIVIVICLNLKNKVIKNWQMYLVVFIQIIFVLLFASRMQILIMAILIPSFFIIRYYHFQQLLKGIIYIVVIFSVAKLFMSMPSALNYRYKQTVSHISSIGLNDENTDPRKAIWLNGIKVINEHFILGTGSGDAKNAINLKYAANILDTPFSSKVVSSTIAAINSNKKTTVYLAKIALINNIEYDEQIRIHAEQILKRQNSKYQYFVKKEYNFHNQYLQTFGTIGIFGFLVLLYLLVMPFITAIKKLDYLVAIFLFIVCSSFLTESMLERQAGVAFFAFFYTLLIITNHQSKFS